MELEKERQMVEQIALKVMQAGGRTFYVGGLVRDNILGKENKDLDIEIHGIEFAKLQEILESLGQLDEHKVGDSFGVLCLRGYDIDIAMPRAERSTGEGHKDFIIEVDPFIGYENAARRRDFTINSLMQDVLTGEIIDSFGGIQDLENGIIRHVDDNTYIEDPLRVLRAAQFATRFGFEIDEQTIELSSKLDLSKLSSERIFGELDKALLKAEKPSVFFDVLRKMNQLDVWFPEVAALIDVPQEPDHHPEGDVYTHTMMVLDEAAKYRIAVEEPRAFMVAALCHDFGKPATTEYNEKKDKITSYGHHKAGVPIAAEFLKRVYNDNRLEKYVLNMVLMHMSPMMLARENANEKSFMQMYDSSISINDLILLSRCDNDGRALDRSFEKIEQTLRQMAEKYEKLMSKPQVIGKDLIYIGYKPGKIFSEMLDYTHKAHLSGIPKDEILKQMVGVFGKPENMDKNTVKQKINELCGIETVPDMFPKICNEITEILPGIEKKELNMIAGRIYKNNGKSFLDADIDDKKAVLENVIRNLMDKDKEEER